MEDTEKNQSLDDSDRYEDHNLSFDDDPIPRIVHIGLGLILT